MGADSPGWQRRPLRSDSPRRATRAGSAPAAPAAPPPASALLDPASAYLAELGPGSRRTMREALDKLANWASDGRCDLHSLPWHLLRLEHTAALRTRLCSTVAPATANKHMAALRGVLKQCLRQGRLGADDFQRAIDLPPIRGRSGRRAPGLSPEDFVRIERICAEDAGPAGARDAALLSLLRASNLRRAEAVALDLDDYDLALGSLTVRPAAAGAPRRLAVPTEARRALERWIAIRGRAAGPLFNPVNKGGRIERRRLSEQAIYIACQKRASEAGLPPTSPEDLRRAFGPR